MKSFYFLFAMAVFGMFCFFEYRGVNTDFSQRSPSPKYYSYRGASGTGVVYGVSSGRSYSSHK